MMGQGLWVSMKMGASDLEQPSGGEMPLEVLFPTYSVSLSLSLFLLIPSCLEKIHIFPRSVQSES